ELSDWATWGDHEYGHSFPVVGLDIINQASIQGMDYALCFKGRMAGGVCSGQPVNLVPANFGGSNVANGLSLVVRDGNLQSYSRRVNLIEETWDSATGKYELFEIPAYNTS